MLYKFIVTTYSKRTYHTNGTKHESECYPWPGPSFGECVTTAVVVEDMATLQLHRHRILQELLIRQTDELLIHDCMTAS